MSQFQMLHDLPFDLVCVGETPDHCDNNCTQCSHAITKEEYLDRLDYESEAPLRAVESGRAREIMLDAWSTMTNPPESF